MHFFKVYHSTNRAIDGKNTEHDNTGNSKAWCSFAFFVVQVLYTKAISYNAIEMNAY